MIQIMLSQLLIHEVQSIDIFVFKHYDAGFWFLCLWHSLLAAISPLQLGFSWHSFPKLSRVLHCQTSFLSQRLDSVLRFKEFRSPSYFYHSLFEFYPLKFDNASNLGRSPARMSLCQLSVLKSVEFDVVISIFSMHSF